MITIFEAAFELQDFCDTRGWDSCFIGGIAVQRWGQARVTRDVEITLLTGFGNEDHFIGPLLAHYASRIANRRTSPPAQEFSCSCRQAGLASTCRSERCHSSTLLSDGLRFSNLRPAFLYEPVRPRT